jgi:hypothetical protein
MLKIFLGPWGLSRGFSWGTRFTGASRRKHPSSVSTKFLSFRASCSEMSSSSHRNAFYTAALQSEFFAPFQYQEVRKHVQTPLNSWYYAMLWMSDMIWSSSSSLPACMRAILPVQDFEEILRSHESGSPIHLQTIFTGLWGISKKSGLRIHVQTISREFK